MFKILAQIIALACFSSGAYAATATGTLAVTATVINSCLVTTIPVPFGILSNFTVNNDQTGTITVTCTNTGNYDITLDVGSGPSPSFAQRKMTSGSNVMNYTLYTTSAPTIVWGDGVTASTGKVTGNGIGAVNYTVYGRVPIQTTPPTGAYTDTVNVTVTF